MLIHIEVPDWLAKFYQKIETELYWMENFFCNLNATNQNIAKI
jgi:hypothetical protein